VEAVLLAVRLAAGRRGDRAERVDR